MTRPLVGLAGAIAVALGALASPADAQPYRWVDAQGHIHYSDERPPRSFQGPVEDLHPRAQYNVPPRPSSPESPRPPEATSPSRPAPAVAQPSDSGPAPAQAKAPAAPPRPAREILDQVGIERWLEYLAGSIRWELSNVDSSSPVSARVHAVIAEAYHRDLLAASVVHAFEQSADRSRIDAVLAWYRSPLGGRLTELRRNPTPAEMTGYETFVGQLPLAPPSPARVAMIHRLDHAWRTSAWEPELNRAVRRSVTRLAGARRGGSRDEDHTTGQTDVRLADDSRRFGRVTWTLYRYQVFTDAELSRYAEFLESPAGAWLTQTARRSLFESLAAAEARAISILSR